MGRRGPAVGVRERARAARGTGGAATERELAVVAAVIAAGSEKAAAHRLGVSHSTVKHHLANARSKVGATTTAQLVWILAQRLPKPAATARADDSTRVHPAPGDVYLGRGDPTDGTATTGDSDRVPSAGRGRRVRRTRRMPTKMAHSPTVTRHGVMRNANTGMST